MGCSGSKPTAAAPAPTQSLTRAPSAPQIIKRIDADTVSPASPQSTAVSLVDGGGAAEPVMHEPTPESVAAAHTVPVLEVVSKAALEGSVKAVLELMKAHNSDAEYQMYACDALASLCAGNEDNRAQVYMHNGVLQVLGAMRLFPWHEDVQTKANWALASMAASYAEYVGKQGGIEAVVAGMRACPDAYQVQTSGTRCLQNLVAASEANRVRASAAGAASLLGEALERNPEDGQLQWRGQQLLARLNSLSREEMERHTAATEVARNSPWSRLRSAVFAGHAKKISVGLAPGLYGASAVVAKKAAEGLPAVLAFMKSHPGYHEIQTWCCDAISTMINGNEEQAKLAHDEGALKLITDALKAGIWEEDLQLKGMWALLALAPMYAADIGDADAISTVVASMYANKTNHQIQVAGVKLLSLLTLESSGRNSQRARDLNAVRVIKATIAAHSDDGTLQYRGVNLLERLEPGCTLSMPKQSMIRSQSMRAEEMVSSYRLNARSFLTASQAEMLSRNSDGSGAGTAVSSRIDVEKMKESHAAIAEVDEMAEEVEEKEEEDGHGGHSHSHGHGHGHSAAAGEGAAAAAAPAQEAPAAAAEAKEAEAATQLPGTTDAS